MTNRSADLLRLDHVAQLCRGGTLDCAQVVTEPSAETKGWVALIDDKGKRTFMPSVRCDDFAPGRASRWFRLETDGVYEAESVGEGGQVFRTCFAVVGTTISPLPANTATKRMEAARQLKTAAAATANRQAGMPTLSGSERQVAWAEYLRWSVLSQAAAYKSARWSQEKLKRFVLWLRDHREADWWIKTKDYGTPQPSEFADGEEVPAPWLKYYKLFCRERNRSRRVYRAEHKWKIEKQEAQIAEQKARELVLELQKTPEVLQGFLDRIKQKYAENPVALRVILKHMSNPAESTMIRSEIYCMWQQEHQAH